MLDKETDMKCKKNYLGASSLMFAIFAISGCWIPFFNIFSISSAIISFLIGVWSLVRVLCIKSKGIDRMILSICGILMSVVAVTVATSTNNSAFSSHGGIKNFVLEVMNAMVGKDIGDKSQGSAGSSTKSTDDSSTLKKTDTKSSTVYKIGESAELNDRKVTIEDVQKDFSMNNEYSAPQEGFQFVKIVIKVENTSASDILVSPQELKIKDSAGSTESAVSATYLLDDQFESATLMAAETKEGAVIFETAKDDESLKLVYQSSTSDEKIEFDLQ